MWVRDILYQHSLGNKVLSYVEKISELWQNANVDGHILARKPKREKQSIVPSEDQKKKRVLIERPRVQCLECQEPAKYEVTLQSARNICVYTFLCKSCKRKWPQDEVRNAIPNVTRCIYDPMQVVAKEIGEV